MSNTLQRTVSHQDCVNILFILHALTRGQYKHLADPHELRGELAFDTRINDLEWAEFAACFESPHFAAAWREQGGRP